jgi:hypothetical protein
VPLSPSERSMRARIAAHANHAKNDSRELTAKARATFRAKFEDEVDPDRVLPPAERARRAEHARKAYYTQLAYKSARARRRAAELTVEAAAAEAELAAAEADRPADA